MRVKPRAVAVAVALILASGAAAVAVVALGRPRAPTYRHDVAPILARHCLHCHGEGSAELGVRLDGFANAHDHAYVVKTTVANRQMPPWIVDDTGNCGKWQRSRWLGIDDITTIIDWVAAGAPEGDGPVRTAEPAEPAEPAEHAARGREEAIRRDRSLEIPRYRPGLGPGGNRCFVLDPKLDRAELLDAVGFRADDPRGVAQISLYALPSETADREARALDDAEPGLGYSCYGTTRVAGERLLASWTGGTPPVRITESGGVRLEPGRALVAQVHFQITRPGVDFATSIAVDLELARGGPELRVVELRADGVLEPSEATNRVAMVYPVEHPMRVVGITPHMHDYGKVLQLRRLRGGSGTCVATFDHFMFRFQELARPREPIALEPGDQLEMSCVYRRTHARVAFGDAIDQEACVATLLVTDP